VPKTTLGATLNLARRMKGQSLKAAAEPARISATYLQKIERGDVQDPSPHVIHRLSEALDLSYEDLMELAGYVVPARNGAALGDFGGPLAQALSNEPMTAEESQALAEYLSFLRHKKPTS
jgi:transcriptional regulator with XRE-family HTH domain